jgi:hypothetical protein
MEFKYSILSISDIDNVIFEDISTTSAVTCRKSIDGSMLVISWIGPLPHSVATLQSYKKYITLEEITELMDSENWKSKDIQ